MLDPETWLDQAKECAQGQRRRVPHDCGSGKVMLVENKDGGYSAWCHRCNDKGWHPHPRPSMEERIARQRAVQAVDDAAAADPRPPMPANFEPTEWPLAARVWLYQAGLDNDTIRANGFYYAPNHERVVMPVLHEGSLAYWQARGFDKSRAKYINPPVDKTRLFAKFGNRGPVVLTEDILSAVRVGQIARGWAVLGTSLSTQQLTQLTDVGTVLVWLDPDAAGIRARSKMLSALRMLNVPCAIIRSDKDPKLYSNEYIAEALQEGTEQAEH